MNNLRSTAQKLLEETDLLSHLSMQGNAHITGSFSYDLMVEPDIDIVVECNDPEKAAQTFAAEEIPKNRWNAVLYYDWTRWRRDYFPQGYYVGLKQDFGEHRWKIDIWFIPAGSEKNEIDILISKATPEQRTLILEAKEYRLKEKRKGDSTAIYKLVIEENVTDLEEIMNRLA